MGSRPHRGGRACTGGVPNSGKQAPERMLDTVFDETPIPPDLSYLASDNGTPQMGSSMPCLPSGVICMGWSLDSNCRCFSLRLRCSMRFCVKLMGAGQV